MKNKPLRPTFKGVKTVCGDPIITIWNISKITIIGPSINGHKNGEIIEVNYER